MLDFLTRCRLPGTYPHDAQLDYFRIADHPPAIAWARTKGENVRPGVLRGPEYVQVGVPQGLRLTDGPDSL